MDWRLAGAVVAGLTLASLIDWLFAGVLFHDRYRAHPEVWRVTGADPRSLIAAQALTIPTVIGMVSLMLMTNETHLLAALGVATLVWLIAAAPAILANGIYIKIHPLVVASHMIALAGEACGGRRGGVVDPGALNVNRPAGDGSDRSSRRWSGPPLARCRD